MISVVGLSFRTAPLEVREALAVPGDAIPDVLNKLASRPEVGEVMLVSTCNRVEVVASPASGTAASQDQIIQVSLALRQGLEEIAKSHGASSPDAHLYAFHGDDAIRHVFRVASSLDSLVIGEPQILGQVKDAFERAREAGNVGPVLTRVVDRALHAAKRVRSETSIGVGSASVASVAVDLARQIFGSLDKRVVLLVGAGQMAESAAQHLISAGAKIKVINRSFERAALLAQQIGGAPIAWEELPSALVEADVVISSTASRGFVLTREIVSRAVKLRRGRELFLIDIAVPRDVDPAVQTLDAVFLHNVDDLEEEVRSSMRVRAGEAEKAEQIVATEVKQLDAWIEARGVTPTIVALRARTRSILLAELERSLSTKLKHLPASDRSALEAMVEAAANKLLHAPITHLKKSASEPAGEQAARVLREVFELPDVSVVDASAPVRRKDSPG
ncbi:MAG: glutamyl-tRNA reductase [Polyangiaceae bacterium]